MENGNRRCQCRPYQGILAEGRRELNPEHVVKSFAALFGVQLIYFSSLVCLLAACAAGGPRVYHLELSFDFFITNRDMEVLDYQFGDSGQLGSQMADFRKQSGKGVGRLGAGIYIPKPEFVYVKWRNKESGKIYEDRASIFLPDDIDDYEITFFVDGPQLYVYLISPYYDRRPADWPKGPVKSSSFLKQWELYPKPTDFSAVKLLHRSDFGK